MSGIDPYYDFYLLNRQSHAINTISTILFYALIIISIVAVAAVLIRRSRISSQVLNLANNAIEMTPEQFMRMQEINLLVAPLSRNAGMPNHFLFVKLTHSELQSPIKVEIKRRQTDWRCCAAVWQRISNIK